MKSEEERKTLDFFQMATPLNVSKDKLRASTRYISADTQE